MPIKDLIRVQRWYVQGRQSLPVSIEAVYSQSETEWAWADRYGDIPTRQLFERERDAIEYAVTVRKTRIDALSAELNLLYNRLDEID